MGDNQITMEKFRHAKRVLDAAGPAPQLLRVYVPKRRHGRLMRWAIIVALLSLAAWIAS